MYERLEQLVRRYGELEKMLSQPEVIQDQNRFKSLAKERAGLEPLVSTYRNFQKVLHDTEEIRKLSRQANDSEMAKLYEEEIHTLSEKKKMLECQLEDQLLEGDVAGAEDKAVLVEIRAGTGGEEAALFSADLFRMYSRFASRSGLAVEVMSSNPTGIGGFKEIIFEVSGSHAYRLFKYESGIHRVQRVPATEASGRIHTSAVTVAVLPEAGEIEVEINPSDLRIDVFRAGGPGGQHVNKADSAVRMTHIPTGMVVSCQDERSQLKNKNKALKILRTRLLDLYQSSQHAERSSARREQVKSGDRSEKIRTYNFPDRRVTDHRIKLTLHNLEGILDGDIAPFVTALADDERNAKLGKKSA